MAHESQQMKVEMKVGNQIIELPKEESHLNQSSFQVDEKDGKMAYPHLNHDMEDLTHEAEKSQHSLPEQPIEEKQSWQELSKPQNEHSWPGLDVSTFQNLSELNKHPNKNGDKHV